MRAEAREQWKEAAAQRGPAEATEEGVAAEARWIRDTAANILDKFAKPQRVCMRSKRWWTDEISELRKALGKAKHTQHQDQRWHRADGVRTARHELRRAIRRAKKECWSKFLENASGDDMWTAVKYSSPRRDDSARPLISGDLTAVTREDKERMILMAAFPEPPPDNGSRTPQGGSAHSAVGQPLVGRLLVSCSNQSAPGCHTPVVQDDRFG